MVDADAGGGPRYVLYVRYAQGGGVDAVGRARREGLRLEAAALFAEDVSAEQVAK